MNKIKTYLTILSILLLPMSVLASQEDRPGCEMYWGRVMPKIRCLAQPAYGTKNRSLSDRKTGSFFYCKERGIAAIEEDDAFSVAVQ
ncbi:hypothetical protein [Candidatus Regiella insecticola]|uniref:hypothetical protein n=1 Tax=Candidatus Regiella insecticola TaxID=138073 RepID=UPI000587027E|nr:hypothetical protein [Candidatus Regiella insecticola]